MKLLSVKKVKLASLLFLLLFIIFQEQGAAQNGLIAVMSYDDAEEIALQSVRRASGIMVKKIDLNKIVTYKDLQDKIKKEKYLRSCFTSDKLIEIKNNRNQIPERDKFIADLKKCYPLRRIRSTDTLDFLGITDEFRLAALRRYIVRNIEIGVSGVWGIENGVGQPFMISGKQLEDVGSGATVTDLAKKIQASAALPFLSYGTVEQIIRNCRYKIKGGKDGASETIKLNTNILADLKQDNLEKFRMCIDTAELDVDDPFEFGEGAKNAKNAKRYKFGVRSIKIVDNEGDSQVFYLTNDFKKEFKNKITAWSYTELAKELAVSAFIPSDDEFLAAQLVINPLFKIAKKREKLLAQQNPKPQGDKSDSRQSLEKKVELIGDSGTTRTFTIFKIAEVFDALRSRRKNDKGSIKNTLKEFEVNPNVLEKEIVAEIENNGKHYLFLKKKDDMLSHLEANPQSNGQPFKLTKPLKDSMTIEEVIEIVEKTIEKQME